MASTTHNHRKALSTTHTSSLAFGCPVLFRFILLLIALGDLVWPHLCFGSSTVTSLFTWFAKRAFSVLMALKRFWLSLPLTGIPAPGCLTEVGVAAVDKRCVTLRCQSRDVTFMVVIMERFLLLIPFVGHSPCWHGE